MFRSAGMMKGTTIDVSGLLDEIQIKWQSGLVALGSVEKDRFAEEADRGQAGMPILL